MPKSKKNKNNRFLLIVFSVSILASFGVSQNVFADAIVNTISLGDEKPWNIAVNPDTNKIYVSDRFHHVQGSKQDPLDTKISIMDGNTNNIVTKNVGFNPEGIAVNPSTNTIYVVDNTNDVVAVIDGNTDEITNRIATGGLVASEVVVNPNVGKIYVTNQYSNTVSVIDSSTYSVIATIPVDSNPIGIAVNPVTNKVYVANLFGKTISVIDSSSDSVVKTIPMSSNPGEVAINPNTNKIYVTSLGVDVIDGSTDTVTNTISVGSGSQGIAVNPNTNKIYVAVYLDNAIAVIDGATNTLTSKISDGGRPFGVAVNTETNMVYVTNSGGRSISVIDGNISAPSSPQNLSANTKSSSQIDLGWITPSNNGGLPITGYQIERSDDGGSTWSIIANTKSPDTKYSDTGLSSNTLYMYRVYAINSAGTSLPSNTVSATTLAIVSVNSVDVAGNPLDGIWMELHTTDGKTIAEGYTPISFGVVQGTQYAVYANNYMQHVFLRWDDGSTDPHRDITTTKNVSLTATYTITTTDQLLK